MAGKASGESHTDERLKQIEEKIRKLEEAQGKSPAGDASGGAAGGILRSIGSVIPGLGGLIENVSKSPAFLERLDEVNAELDRRLRETPLKNVEPHVSGGVSSRPMGIPPGARGGPSATRPTPRAKAKRKRPEQRLAGQPPEELAADVFDEGDHVAVIVELPGVAAEDVEVTLEGRTLSIAVTAAGAKRHLAVEMPCDAQGEPQRSLNKGILKVQIEKATTDD